MTYFLVIILLLFLIGNFVGKRKQGVMKKVEFHVDSSILSRQASV